MGLLGFLINIRSILISNVVQDGFLGNLFKKLFLVLTIKI